MILLPISAGNELILARAAGALVIAATVTQGSGAGPGEGVSLYLVAHCGGPSRKNAKGLVTLSEIVPAHIDSFTDELDPVARSWIQRIKRVAWLITGDIWIPSFTD